MSQHYRFNLTFAILASLAALLLLTWILLSIISFKTAEKDMLSIRASSARTLLRSIVSTLPEDFALAKNTGVPMQKLVDSLSADKDFAGFSLIGSDGKVIYSQDDRRGVDAALKTILKGGIESSNSVENSQTLLTYIVVGPASGPVGAARLTLSLDEVHARLVKSRKLFMIYFF